jgi:predicted metal-dependent HD superfamily phosphohydrolase
MDLISQEKHWSNFVAPLVGSSNQELLSSWFSRLCTSYSEPQRHYHTLKHIYHMFTLLEEHKTHLKSQERVAMSIWFHECVFTE